MSAGDEYFAYVFGTPGRDVEFYWYATDRQSIDLFIAEGGRIDSSSLPDVPTPDSCDPLDWTPEQFRRFRAVHEYLNALTVQRAAHAERQRRIEKWELHKAAAKLGDEVEDFLRAQGAE